ncbi:MAG: AAA family ATPase [Dehalococcoidaceae bacterium]|nr:AAA family ATPase [Dehalococcoidaceae bacterium]
MHLKKVTLQSARYPDINQYPFNLDIIRATREIDLERPVTLFVGENGTGKSTVLKAICLRCGIHIWQLEESRRHHYNPLEDQLYRCMDIEWADGSVPGAYFSAQIFEYFTRMLDGCAAVTPKILEYYGGSSLKAMSHGQSIISYFEARYKIKGLYLLDEPETALSPKSQLKLRDIIHKYARAGNAQFIIATHSPILLSMPGARIYNFDAQTLSPVEFEKTEHYRIYRDFFTRAQ